MVNINRLPSIHIAPRVRHSPSAAGSVVFLLTPRAFRGRGIEGIHIYIYMDSPGIQTPFVGFLGSLSPVQRRG